MSKKEKGLSIILNHDSLLRCLGATIQYKGYSYILTALDLLQKDRNLICSLTKILYPGVGAQFNTSGADVEHCMRTVIHHMWIVNQPLMQAVIGYPIKSTPTIGEFLAAVITLPSDFSLSDWDNQTYMVE